ncbi:hypothetical protein [Streptomyces syringium]|uniref:FXSXX-COOH protein n=1 Tax=Streptomyces syringium TaxID=76729 RepID=A0ABS4XZ82_9ACTN|nr:hypothetical protein [Streptomyces syringium]MBP2401809.1 hypothetical protein [Streptomyces syringium]
MAAQKDNLLIGVESLTKVQDRFTAEARSPTPPAPPRATTARTATA